MLFMFLSIFRLISILSRIVRELYIIIPLLILFASTEPSMVPSFTHTSIMFALFYSFGPSMHFRINTHTHTRPYVFITHMTEVIATHIHRNGTIVIIEAVSEWRSNKAHTARKKRQNKHENNHYTSIYTPMRKQQWH